ncbi:MAG: O-antigen ligase family protein [Candidatus Omnitrophota bacterium]|jgi:O-antigen ligase/tetratricopeptide (TPR) repeat protein|nr:MAG: O-antigen ligase family protein [Candidatus Omnitrophota bacterium]
MRKQFSPPPSPIISYLDLSLQLMLIFQILSTGLYFNGYFTNPLINKILLGEILALTAWLLFFWKAFAEKRLVLIWSPYYLPAFVLLVWAGIRSYTGPTPVAQDNFYIFALILSAFPLWVTEFRYARFRRLYIWGVFFAGLCFVIGGLRQLMLEEPRFDWSFFPAITLSKGEYERQTLGMFLGHNNAASAYIWITTIYAGYLWYSLRRSFFSALFGVFILCALTLIFYCGSRGVALMIPPSLLVIGVGLYLARFKKNKETKRNDHSQIVTPFWSRKAIVVGSVLIASLFILGLLISRAPLAQKQLVGVYNRFQTSTETLLSGTYPRVWLFSLVMVREKPLTGVGFSAWSYEYPYTQELWYTTYPQTKIGLPPINKFSEHAHNDYLQTWAELGIPGLLCMFWLLFIHARGIWKIFRSHPIPIPAIFAAAATVATLVHTTVAFPFHEAAASCLFLANLALVSWHVCDKKFVRTFDWLPQRATGPRGFMSAAALAVYIASAYPVYNYIVGDFGARQYKIYADYTRGMKDPATIHQYLERGYAYLLESTIYLPNIGPTYFTIGCETYGRAKRDGNEQLFLQGIDYLKRSLETYSYYDTYGHIGRAYRLVWELTQKPDYFEAAVTNFKNAVSIMPTFEEGWAQIGLLYAKNGQAMDALNLLAETELRFPGFIDRTIYQGALDMEAQGDLELSAMLFNIASTIKNVQIEKHFHETIAFYLRHDRPDMAVNMIAGSTENQTPESITKAVTYLLVNYLYQKKFEEAWQLTEELRKQETLQPIKEIWYFSGIVAWISGRPVDTLFCWEQALEKGMPREQLSGSYSVVNTLICTPHYLK